MTFSWPFAQTWTFTRAATQDRNGDRAGETTFTVAGCVFWSEGVAGSTRAEVEDDFRRNTTTSRANIAVPVEADVRATDRPTSPTGEKFTFIGQGRWDMPHALTGWRPGYRLFRMQGVT
jgi:hypothetical protein